MIDLSIYEAIMLFCFGASWPFSVIKTFKTKSVKGKSSLFLILVFIGYSSGIIHKIVYSLDIVIILYVFNAVMVFLELVLYYMYHESDNVADLQDMKAN